MFSKRSPVLRAMALLAILFVAAGKPLPVQRHELLENKDLTDLLDADLDQPFRPQAPRVLQEEEGMTAVPSSAPTPSPEGVDGERGFETFSPTPAVVTEAPVTSGASSLRSSAGVASALIFVGSVAAAAVMA